MFLADKKNKAPYIEKWGDWEHIVQNKAGNMDFI
jgi:hypothetical protein